MLRSMTGFGFAERTIAGQAIQIEVRSVNHRYSEVIIRHPREWSRYEEGIRKYVLGHIKRGRVEVHLNVEKLPVSQKEVIIDWPLLEAYHIAAEQIDSRFHLKETLTLKDLLFAPDAVQFREQAEVTSETMELELQACLQEALTQLLRMRDAEGHNLYDDLDKLLRQLEQDRLQIASLSGGVVQEYKQKLAQRIQELLGQEKTIDESRLAMEVAIFADKCDVQEELARLQSHLQQFKQLMEDSEPSGRRMDFLIQEMNREVNTMGSKANHVDVTNHVVAMKAELEKLREQVQNIE